MEVVNFVKPWSGMSQKKLRARYPRRETRKTSSGRSALWPELTSKPFSEIGRHRPDDAPNKLVGFPVRHPGNFCFSEPNRPKSSPSCPSCPRPNASESGNSGNSGNFSAARESRCEYFSRQPPSVAPWSSAPCFCGRNPEPETSERLELVTSSGMAFVDRPQTHNPFRRREPVGWWPCR